MSAAAYRAPAAHRQLIKALVAGRVGCEPGTIPDAPRFRYIPPNTPAELCDMAPSNRGSLPGAWPWRLKNYRPEPLSCAPMYQVAMAGDPADLTDARRAWHNGDPGPLRELLNSRPWAAPETAPEPAPELPLAMTPPAARRAPVGIVRAAARKVKK